jgi:hypothetical protein
MPAVRRNETRRELRRLGVQLEPADRSRLPRRGLAHLFLELRNLRGEALQSALGNALGDRDLVVAYPRADGTLPAPHAGRSVAPIERDGSPIAALVYDASLDDDPELVEAVTAAAAIALETERLQAESQAQLAELQASRERIVAAGDAERRRLERNRTTALNNASSPLPANSASSRPTSTATRRRPKKWSTPQAISSPSRSRSCASSRAAFIPPSWSTGSPRPSTHSPGARRSRRPSHATRPSDCPRRSSSPPTSWRVRRWPTWPNTPHATERRSRSRAPIAGSPSRSPTTASAARTRPRDQGCAAWPTGSRLGGSLLVTSPAGAGTVVNAELPI